MKNNDNEKVISIWIWIFLVIFIAIIILVYILSLGNVNIANESKILPDFKDTKEEAIKKHAQLQVELEKLQVLKLKLDRYFKFTYLIVRVLLIGGVSTLVYFIGKYFGAKTLSDMLDFYEASIIILFGLNFIAFGTVANSKEFIKLIRANVENFVWRKNLMLMTKIESFQKELVTLKESINESDGTIYNSNKKN